MEEFLRRRVAYKIEFDKHRGHRHAPQHPESGLTHVFVGASGLLHQIALSPRGKIEALVEMRVLREFEYYIRFRRIRVEILVTRPAVLFELHNRVFAHGHTQVRVRLVKPAGVDTRAFHGGAPARFLVN